MEEAQMRERKRHESGGENVCAFGGFVVVVVVVIVYIGIGVLHCRAMPCCSRIVVRLLQQLSVTTTTKSILILSHRSCAKVYGCSCLPTDDLSRDRF